MTPPSGHRADPRGRTDESAALGQLRVSIGTQSAFLSGHLRAEVRDAEFELVGTVAEVRPLEVPAGLYQVSVVLDDGRTHSKVVEVEPGARRQVDFYDSTARAVGAIEAGDVARLRRTEALEVRATFPSELKGYVFRGLESFLPWKLNLLEGATRIAVRDDEWVFDAPERSVAVPHASVSVGHTTYDVSLPVNPDGLYPKERTCSLLLERHHDLGLRVLIPRERNVSSALQQMMAHGQTFRASELMVDAVRLLLDKYRDPVGATLGALVLHERGTLREHSEWLANLTRDFGWMPDAKILTAALALQQGREDEAAEHAITAAAQRPMFTLSFSILVDMLRSMLRRLEGSQRAPVAAAFRGLSSKLATVDWEALTYTVRDLDAEEEEDNA